LAGKDVTRQSATNAWKWTADDISDVAVAISDHYVWDASSVIVDHATNRRASVQAAYNDTAKDFHYMVGFGRHALSWLSANWPGVPYPFPKTTIVQGYADMEYPMMVNDGTTPDTSFSKFVAEHEIAHTWFPFYMGINETRYGFMDEGWATTFEYLIGTADNGKEKATGLYKNFRINRWIHDNNAEEDLPIITPGNALSGPGLGNNEYGKASIGYLAMKDYLGDEEFRKCLHAFMDRWHGKHPIPWDFFNTFNDVSGKNLNWFWNAWYFSNGYIDLSIDQVEKKRKAYEITIKNIGGFPAPTDLTLHYTDGSTETKHLSPAIWEANLQEAKISIDTRKTLNLVTMDGGIYMDANMANNQWKP
ncbi:MAG: M1 family peptidase, partial [Bacteroidota bacterium]|nr:M1 family peptidase [Bacteroidota bacterium]